MDLETISEQAAAKVRQIDDKLSSRQNNDNSLTILVGMGMGALPFTSFLFKNNALKIAFPCVTMGLVYCCYRRYISKRKSSNDTFVEERNWYDGITIRSKEVKFNVLHLLDEDNQKKYVEEFNVSYMDGERFKIES